MTKTEFKAAFKIAQDSTVDLSKVDDGYLFGCGLKDFKPVSVRLVEVAKLLRWQGYRWDGSWDMIEVEKVREIAKKKFIVVG
jgi:hypothetical protein